MRDGEKNGALVSVPTLHKDKNFLSRACEPTPVPTDARGFPPSRDLAGAHQPARRALSGALPPLAACPYAPARRPAGLAARVTTAYMWGCHLRRQEH